MGAFRSGQLVRPNALVKASPYPVVRGTFLHRPGYPFEWVYAKLLPANRRAIEQVCAWIARDMDLPTPEPVSVTVDRSRLQRDMPWPFDQDRQICFGTVEVPQAQKVRRLESQPIREILSRWPKLIDATAFDMLIANEDRSEENLLIDGHGQLWLADHDRALGGAGESLFSSTSATHINLFMKHLKELPLPRRIANRPAILSACAVASAAVARIQYQKLGLEAPLAEQVAAFLEKRSKMLAQMMLSEIGLPEMFSQDADLRPPLH